MYNALSGGDMNWIIPNKVLALSSPDDRIHGNNGTMPFSKLINTFKKLGLKNVLRLNEDYYEKDEFERSGIRHFDMEYPDGSCPCREIVEEGIEIFKSISGFFF